MMVFRFSKDGFSVERNINFEPQNNCPMHTHDHIELYYFVSGDCVCYVEGTEYKLQPRDILIIRPFEAHTMRWFSKRPYERIGFCFPVELLKKCDPSGKLLEHLMARPLGTDNRFTDADFGHTFCADSLQQIDKDIDYTGLLSRAVLVLSEAMRATERQGNGKRSEELSARIIDYVNRELGSSITAEKVSKEFFISRSQTNRIFREKTGASFGQYVTAKRMIAARSRIESGEPASVVAAECGYADYSAFYRAYKKYFGISPKGK